MGSAGRRPATGIGRGIELAARSHGIRHMSRQDANSAFARTSFLYGGNASYIEDLYAKYETDPAAVDAEWQELFRSLKDERADVVKSARGASWKKPNWP